jgi:hypothetical protein
MLPAALTFITLVCLVREQLFTSTKRLALTLDMSRLFAKRHHAINFGEYPPYPAQRCLLP